MMDSPRLRSSREKLLIEALADYQFTARVYPDGTMEVDYLSGAFLHDFGYDPARFKTVGDWLSIIVAEDRDRVYNFIAAIQDSDQDNIEFRLQNTNSEEVWIRYYPVIGGTSPDGAGLSIHGALEVIQSEKMAEFQLMHSQRMESLGRIAGGVAHDFNNVLATISGAIQLLQVKVPEDDSLAHYWDMIQSAITRGQAVTKRLSTFSGTAEFKKKPLVISSLLENIQTVVQHSFPKAVTYRFPDFQPGVWVKGDKEELTQAILNILVNAVDAMAASGTLTLSMPEEIPAGLVTFDQQVPTTNHAVIAITDTGHGIPGETLSKIFDPFYSEKSQEKGSGMGLAITYKIIQAHDGWIGVTSKPGDGTTFYLGLPVSTPPEHKVQPTHDIQEEIAPAHLLIIEDELPLRQIYQEALLQTVHSFTFATTGEEGLSVFREQRSEVDIILTDLGLPELSGMEVVKNIRSMDSTLPIIVVTGYQNSQAKQALEALSVTAILQKPFVVEDIIQIVNGLASHAQ